MKYKKKRLVYFSIFTLLLVLEVLIALFVHDRIIRPYIGDTIVVVLIYCAIRTVFPTGIKLLPLYVFLFASCVEVFQYFDILSLLGLQNNTVLRIAIGSTFSIADIFCYLFGCLAVGAAEYLRK